MFVDFATQARTWKSNLLKCIRTYKLNCGMVFGHLNSFYPSHVMAPQ